MPALLSPALAGSTDDLASLVRRLAAEDSLWLPRIVDASPHQRAWAHLHATPDLDIWLLSWLPDQRTELHDHGGSDAAFTVLRGVLEEQRATPDGRLGVALHGPGAVSRITPGQVHDVRGAGTTPALSLHAYSPPLTTMTYYDRDDAGRLQASRTVATTHPEDPPA